MVKAPVDGVDAPTAVPFIPVAVVLKFPDVIKTLLTPVFTEKALKPDNESAPDVPVMFTPPVVTVSPLDAVNKPSAVIVPVPVAEILPLVVRAPVVDIDQVGPPVRARVVPAVEFPIVIAFAFAFVPILMEPVVPESSVTAPVVPVLKDKLFPAPVDREEEFKPESVMPPEVPIILTAPVETVIPLEAVSKPADVTAPLPVVAMFPVVDTVIFEARSLPDTAANVGKPDAFP